MTEDENIFGDLILLVIVMILFALLVIGVGVLVWWML
jgi:hypothetical protein